MTADRRLPTEPETTPDRIEVGPGVFVSAEALHFQFSRSGGPGGQNVNKLNTKAQLWVSVDDLQCLPPDARQRLQTIAGKRLTGQGQILISAQTARTQESNRQAVLDRLRQMLVAALHRPKRRRPTRPSAGSKRRRLETKKKRSDIKAGRRGLAE